MSYLKISAVPSGRGSGYAESYASLKKAALDAGTEPSLCVHHQAIGKIMKHFGGASAQASNSRCAYGRHGNGPQIGLVGVFETGCRPVSPTSSPRPSSPVRANLIATETAWRLD